MSNNVIIDRVSPMGAIPPILASSSKHVIRRRTADIFPESNTSFSYTTNGQMVFDIDSPTDFINFSNSYLRFNLNCTLNNNGSDITNKYLAEGGVHSLFRSLTIESKAGTLIQRIDRYNKLYAKLSQATHSKDYVNDVLWRAGDSVDITRQVLPLGQPLFKSVSYTQSEANYDHTGGAAEQLLILATTAGGARAREELEVGDLLRIETAVLNYTCRVLTIESALSITVDGLPAADILANAILSIQVLKENTTRGVNPARTYFANTADVMCVMQPMAPFLQMKEWIPLFLMRGGLRITLELERPEYCLAAPVEYTGTGFSGANCVITNPVWVCDMIEPDQELSKAYVDMFKGQGIVYSFLSFRHQLDTYGSGSGVQNSNINANVRSARYVLSYIQNTRAETIRGATKNSGLSTYTCDSVAQGLKAGLRYVQYQSGSERFPLSRPLDLQSASNAEALIQLEKVFGQAGNTAFNKRFYPQEWMAIKNYIKEYEFTEATDSNRLILCADLSRDDSSFCGLDLSLSPLNAQFEFTSAYSLYDKDGTNTSETPAESDKTRYVHHHVAHDVAFVISSNAMQVYQ